MLRVGLDVTSVQDVKDSIAVHGERYLARVFTPQERRDTADDATRLAARFAAKEAVFKVLRLADDAVPWHDIRIRRHPEGYVDLVLSGQAKHLAAAQGLTELALSITHQGDHAAAVVVAT